MCTTHLKAYKVLSAFSCSYPDQGLNQQSVESHVRLNMCNLPLMWLGLVAHLSIFAASSWVMLRKLMPFTSSIWSPIWHEAIHQLSINSQCLR